MDRHLYIDILDKTLKPFIQKAYPNGHRLMTDNDPKPHLVMLVHGLVIMV